MSFSLFLAFVSLTSMMSYPTLAEERNRELYFPAYYFIAQRRLKNHIIKTLKVKDLDLCELLCYQHDDCVSLNIKKDRDGATNLHECELNNSTHLEHGADLKTATNPIYYYRGAKNACGMNVRPCENNSTCQSGFTDKGYRCYPCTPGFEGDHCEIDIDDCARIPCMNGTCTDLVNGFNCSCAPGFNGTLCDTDIDECKSNPCINNGTCTDRVNGFNCSCPSGFYGKRCGIGFLITSTILSGNRKYMLNHLARFLAPAVGNHSNWELCYETQATNPSWKVRDFHKKCDNKNHTVTIIRNNQYVFGGYTDIAWESVDGYNHIFTPNAFIFSLENTEGLTPFKIMVATPSQDPAVIHNKDDSPIFGEGNIVIDSNGHVSNAKLGDSYPAPSEVQDDKKETILAGEKSFKPTKVEVFFLN